MEHTPDSSAMPDRLREVMLKARLKAQREAPPIHHARTCAELKVGLIFTDLEEPSADNTQSGK